MSAFRIRSRGVAAFLVLAALFAGAAVPAAGAPAAGEKAVEAKAAYDRGVALMARKEYARAVEALQQSVRANPDDAEAWVNLARCYDAMGRPKESRDAYLQWDRIVQQQRAGSTSGGSTAAPAPAAGGQPPVAPAGADSAAKAEALFKQADITEDGFLSGKERAGYEALDADRDGRVTREEFMAAMAPRPAAVAEGPTREQIEAEYRKLDINDDGTLSGKEMGPWASRDADGDGQLSLAEYAALRARRQPEQPRPVAPVAPENARAQPGPRTAPLAQPAAPAAPAKEAPAGALTEEAIKQVLIRREKNVTAGFVGRPPDSITVNFESVRIGETRKPNEQDRINGIRGDVVYPVRAKFTAVRRWSSGKTAERTVHYNYDFYRDAFGEWNFVGNGPVK